jgi:hypothetical protein
MRRKKPVGAKTPRGASKKKEPIVLSPEQSAFLDKIRDYPDGTEIVRFTIPGRPSTKKTHQRIIRVKGGGLRIISGGTFLDYEKLCEKYCREAWSDYGYPPIDFGVSVSLEIHMNNWMIGDHCGYMQSLGDIIEKWGVIANDQMICWTIGVPEGHWLKGIDKENPRTQIIIKRFRHPKESAKIKSSKKAKTKDE